MASTRIGHPQELERFSATHANVRLDAKLSAIFPWPRSAELFIFWRSMLFGEGNVSGKLQLRYSVPPCPFPLSLRLLPLAFFLSFSVDPVLRERLWWAVSFDRRVPSTWVTSASSFAGRRFAQTFGRR